MISIKDKVIVVTGGNGLLGKQMITIFRNNGALAISVDINFEKQGDDDFLMDITNEDSVKSVVNSIIKKYNKIDGWINNAYPRTNDWGNKFENIILDSWRKNVDMQMNTTFLFIQKVMPELLKNKGSVVNITSIYGVVGNDLTIYENTSITTAAPYSAIKGGIINFTRYLASYYGRQGVRVNCVSPGGILDKQHNIFIENYEKKVPMGRMGNPDDIAPAVSFLLSDDAKYITGQNIIIDGGWTAI